MSSPTESSDSIRKYLPSSATSSEIAEAKTVGKIAKTPEPEASDKGAKPGKKPAKTTTGGKAKNQGKGSKECKFYAAGNCRKGDKCRFTHNGGSSPQPKQSGKRVVTLDSFLSDEDLGKLRADFPTLNVVNGPLMGSAHGETSGHAYERAERACITHVYPAWEDSPGRKVLEVQGRVRRTDKLARDVCRHVVTAEDDDYCCADDCVHEDEIKRGTYHTVVAVDVPMEPDTARTYLNYGVQQILLAIHLHRSHKSNLGKQTGEWVPDPDSDFPVTGSVGRFLCSVPGRAGWTEKDHAWLSMQWTLRGVKPETVGFHGSYTVVRLTRTAATYGPIEPIRVPSPWPVMRARAGPGYYQVGRGRKGSTLDIVRVTDKLVLLRTEQIDWRAYTGDQIRTVCTELSARPLDESMRKKTVVNLAREYRGEVAASELVTMLFDVFLQENVNHQDSLDKPAAFQGPWYIPYRLRSIFALTRREAAARVIDRARQKVGVWLNWTRGWALTMGICTGLIYQPYVIDWQCEPDTELTISTWLARTCVPSYRLTWYKTIQFVVLMALLGFPTVRGQTHAMALREAYTTDRFADLAYHGPLPEGFGLPGYIADRAMATMGDGCKIKIREPNRDVNPSNVSDALFAVGVVFAGFLPSVAASCQQNLVVAVRNRQLAARPDPDTKVFGEWADAYLSNFNKMYDYPDIDYDAWNSRFPRSRQKEHDEAREGLANQIYNAFDITVRAGFTKVEKIMRLAKGAYDPRCITGATAAFNVIFGQWFHFAKHAIHEAYNDLHGNVMLVESQTSAELGAWFEEAMLSGGRAVCGDDQLIAVDGLFIEADGVRHDSAMHELFIKLKWEIYARVMRSIPIEVQRWARDSARRTVARNTIFQVFWEHNWRTRSGDADTKTGNGVDTDFVAYVVQETVRRLQPADHCVAGVVEREVLKLGYEITTLVTRDPAQVSFLSGSFMPVDGVMYWYPHPGRQIAKLGWTIRRNSTTKQRYRDFAGALNSFQAYCFVPFLRRYIDRVSELVPEEFRLEPPSKRWAIGSGSTPYLPADDTWDWFTRRYGLTRSDEDAFVEDLADRKSVV